MTGEEAYYGYLLLLCGEDAAFDAWLDRMLACEEPLSDTALALSFCGADQKKMARTLSLYCMEAPFDETVAYTKLRTALCEGYLARTMTSEAVIDRLRLYSQRLPPSGFQNDCNAISDYYDLAKSGILVMSNVEHCLAQWLQNGAALSPFDM